MARRPRTNWRTGQVVTLHAERVQEHQRWGSDAYTVAHFWRLHSLALHLPQRFPEYVSDADIEATVRHVVATEWLPWEIME